MDKQIHFILLIIFSLFIFFFLLPSYLVTLLDVGNCIHMQSKLLSLLFTTPTATEVYISEFTFKCHWHISRCSQPSFSSSSSSSASCPSLHFLSPLRPVETFYVAPALDAVMRIVREKKKLSHKRHPFHLISSLFAHLLILQPHPWSFFPRSYVTGRQGKNRVETFEPLLLPLLSLSLLPTPIKLQSLSHNDDCAEGGMGKKRRERNLN